jgi:UDP-glucuronate decarboxylase
MIKKVLVTGGAGFLGSHLCIRLIGLGYDVTCLDNLSTGSLDNVKTLINHPRFRFIQHDVIYPYEVDCEEIYNLASPASPIQYQLNPIQTAKSNIFGAIHSLELAKRNGAKVLQASTSEIYGDPLIHPQLEDYWGHVNPIGIRSCYDEGKRAAETFFMDYYRQFGVRIKILRIFNTYGPKMAEDDGRVVSNFILQALSNTPITIYGNGSQTRSFCYVDDLIDALISMMASDESVIGPINVGNPEEITILGLAQTIINLTQSSSPILHKELPMDDPIRRKPDIHLAQSLLGWQPRTTLQDGLRHTIRYFRQD